MRTIVLGGTGQLGQEWKYQLEDSDDTEIDFISGYGSQEVDITETSDLKEVLLSDQPDLIINCAAYTDVDGAEENKELAVQVNSRAVANLARLCADRQVKLVHYSTDYVFPGSSKDKDRLPGGYPEEHATDPVNWYGATKLKGEEAIRREGADHLILRTSWLCGAFGSNFITTMLRLAGQRDQLDVVNDQWGSPSFTKNVVRNSMHLIMQQLSGTYHITSGGLTTWCDFAREIFKQTGKDIHINPVSSDAFETKAKRPAFSKLNTRKLSSVEGSEIITWQTGLKQLLDQLNY